MNVRCYLLDTNEFIYPESQEYKDLSTFYGVLEGYKAKQRPFEVTWGTSILDVEGNEVFSGDKVEAIFPKRRNKNLYPSEIEKGIVEYEDGCFVFISEERGGFVRDLDPSFFKMRIISYALKEES